MKEKKVKDRKAGALTLTIKPGKHEEFVYSEAEWLATGPHPNLAAFRYTLQGADAVLYYDLTGLTDLKSYLKASLGGGQYQSMLVAVEEVLSLCTKLNYPTSELQFAVDHVYVQPDGTLRFLFVPLTGVSATQDNTPRALLQYLADRSHVSFVVPDDTRHAASLFDYVKRNTVFSLASYREYLADEFHVAPAGAASSGRLSGGGGTGSGRGTGGGSGSFSARTGGSGGLSGVSGARGGTGRTGTTVSVGAASQARARGTIDPVSLLQNAPASSEVLANQGMSGRVKDAVAGVSPTAAPSAAVAAVSSAPLGAGTGGAGTGVVAAGQTAAETTTPAAEVTSPAAEPAPEQPQPQVAAGSGKISVGEPEPASPAAGDAAEPAAPAPADAQEQVPAATAGVEAVPPEPEVTPSAPPGAPEAVQTQSQPQPASSPAATPSPAPVSNSAYAAGSSSGSASSSYGGAASQVSSFSGAAFSEGAPTPSGTTLLGGRAARSVFGSGSLGNKPCYLLRERDGSRYPIEGSDALVVGRSASSDIQLAGNSNLSRAHASVCRVGAVFEVADLGSSNGTFVNGARLARGQTARVGLGEEFRLADEYVKIVE